MKRSAITSRVLTGFAAMLILATSIGCRSTYGPSRYHSDDEITYFTPGPEFKLANEAAAMKAAAEGQARAQANSAAEANSKNTQR
jgi:hypothetical protein